MAIDDTPAPTGTEPPLTSDTDPSSPEFRDGAGADSERQAASTSPEPTDPTGLVGSADPAQTVAAPVTGQSGTGGPGSTPGRWGRSKARAKRRKAPWWELPLLIAIAVVVAMLIKTFLVQPYYIPSESMENTLYGCSGCSGDRILVNKPIYHLRDPHPGDIVVFKAPTGWDDEPTPATPSNPIVKAVRWVGQLVGVVPPDENDLVKRVIAVGGQTVQCCDSQGRVQVSDNGPNGPWRSLDEPFIYQDLPWDPTSKPGETANGSALSQRRTFGPVTVPKGRLWVMGDHRSVSEDSRWHYANDFQGDATNSTVPAGAVIGKAVLIVWPPSRWRTLGTPNTFKTAAVALSGPVAPPLGAAFAVVPVWFIRRRRRGTEPASPSAVSVRARR